MRRPALLDPFRRVLDAGGEARVVAWIVIDHRRRLHGDLPERSKPERSRRDEQAAWALIDAEYDGWAMAVLDFGLHAVTEDACVWFLKSPPRERRGYEDVLRLLVRAHGDPEPAGPDAGEVRSR
jgi:hypothetical protein